MSFRAVRALFYAFYGYFESIWFLFCGIHAFLRVVFRVRQFEFCRYCRFRAEDMCILGNKMKKREVVEANDCEWDGYFHAILRVHHDSGNFYTFLHLISFLMMNARYVRSSISVNFLGISHYLVVLETESFPFYF